MNKKVDYSAKSNEELMKDLFLNKKELMNLRFRSAVNDLTDTSMFKKLKKNVARIFTIINLRKKAGV